jgi:hypothetical protein
MHACAIDAVGIHVLHRYSSIVIALVGSLVQGALARVAIHVAQAAYESPPASDSLEAPLLISDSQQQQVGRGGGGSSGTGSGGVDASAATPLMRAGTSSLSKAATTASADKDQKVWAERDVVWCSQQVLGGDISGEEMTCK